jgi:hypothetical protein
MWHVWGDRRGEYKILVERNYGMRPFGRYRHRWECNIKIEIQKVGWGWLDWIVLAQDRDRRRAVLNAVGNLSVS